MLTPDQLIQHAIGFQFEDIKVLRNGDGTWTAHDMSGFRLVRDGIFIGCPSANKIRYWVEDSSFDLISLIELLMRVRPKLFAYAGQRPL